LEQRKRQAESKEASDGEEQKDECIVITELETKPRGRPVLLGEQLDCLVKEFISTIISGICVYITCSCVCVCGKIFFPCHAHF